MLGVMGYDVSYEECDAIRDAYFTPEQLGDYDKMVPGFVDVSLN